MKRYSVAIGRFVVGHCDAMNEEEAILFFFPDLRFQGHELDRDRIKVEEVEAVEECTDSSIYVG